MKKKRYMWGAALSMVFLLGSHQTFAAMRGGGDWGNHFDGSNQSSQNQDSSWQDRHNNQDNRGNQDNSNDNRGQRDNGNSDQSQNDSRSQFNQSGDNSNNSVQSDQLDNQNNSNDQPVTNEGDNPVQPENNASVQVQINDGNQVTAEVSVDQTVTADNQQQQTENTDQNTGEVTQLQQPVHPPVQPLNQVTQTPVNGSQGMVSLTFDDGWLSQYNNAEPILQNAGVPATFYIISNAMINADTNGNGGGSQDSYMNTDQVRALQSAGNEIGNHTADHCDLVMLEQDPQTATQGACASPTFNPRTPAEEIEQGQQGLVAQGFHPDTFAYPYGTFDPSIEQTLQSEGFLGARTVNGGLNSSSTDKYALNTEIVDLNATQGGIDVVKANIDQAAAKNQWLILTFHNVEAMGTLQQNGDVDGTTPEFLQEIVNYIQQKQIPVVTVHQALSQ